MKVTIIYFDYNFFERGIFVGNDWEIKFLLGDTSCSIIKNACNFIQTPIN